MNNKPMPDWMMEYASNIGTDECYNKFRDLSKEYYKEIEDIGGGGHSKPVARLDLLNINRINKDDNLNPKYNKAEFDITEKYKKKSRELAREHGYDTQKPLEKIYENDPTLNNREMVSREDRIAKGLHKDFKKQYSEKSANAKDNEKKYRDREYKEYHNEKRQERSTIKFDKSQGSFEAKRQEAFIKRNQPVSKDKTEKDNISPTPNNNYTGEVKKTPDIADKSKNQDIKSNFEQNKSDTTTKSHASNRYFSSIGIEKNNQEKSTTKEKPVEKTDINKSREENQEVKIEQPRASERYFDSPDFNQNKENITTEKSSVDKSEPAKDKALDDTPSKSVDLDKD